MPRIPLSLPGNSNLYLKTTAFMPTQHRPRRGGMHLISLPKMKANRKRNQLIKKLLEKMRLKHPRQQIR